LPFGILFLMFEGLFLSDQEFSRCIHGLVECSGQVKVCGLVTLGVGRLLDGLGIWRVLGELLEIVGASRQVWCLGCFLSPSVLFAKKTFVSVL
jgi:hypothetical protein